MKRTPEQRKLDCSEVAAHLSALIDAGQTYSGLSRLTGVHPSSLKRAHLGQSNPRRNTRERILGVPLNATAKRYEPAWQSLALVAELKRAGMTNAELADVMGWKEKSIAKYVGPDQVTVKTHERFRTLYRFYATKGLVPASLLDESRM
jgi:lambda repressor-like predicted transcriptional regulator